MAMHLLPGMALYHRLALATRQRRWLALLSFLRTNQIPISQLVDMYISLKVDMLLQYMVLRPGKRMDNLMGPSMVYMEQADPRTLPTLLVEPGVEIPVAGGDLVVVVEIATSVMLVWRGM